MLCVCAYGENSGCYNNSNNKYENEIYKIDVHWPRKYEVFEHSIEIVLWWEKRDSIISSKDLFMLSYWA